MRYIQMSKKHVSHLMLPAAGWATFFIAMIITITAMLGKSYVTSLGMLWMFDDIPTAIGFVTSAVAYCVSGRSQRSIRVQKLCGWLLIVGSICQFTIAVNPILMPLLQAQKFLFLSTFDTLAGFLIIGIVILLTTIRDPGQPAIVCIRGLTGLLVAVMVVTICSYILNLEFLYIRSDLTRMAPISTVGFSIQCVGLWSIWRRRRWNILDPSTVVLGQLSRTSAMVLVVMAIFIALISFALSQDRAELLLAKQMGLISVERMSHFNVVLTMQNTQSVILSSRPALIQATDDFISGHKSEMAEAKQTIGKVTSVLVANGMSAAMVTTPSGHIIASSGTMKKSTAFGVPVGKAKTDTLIWVDGFILHSKHKIEASHGNTVGYMITEQPLPSLTAMHQDAIKYGSTGDLVICGKTDTHQICFPTKWRDHPDSYPLVVDGKPLPLTRAMQGERLTTVTIDFRRERVMAAFGPIGDTGLGMAVKMDMWELYSPIRQQFLAALPLIFILVVFSVGLLHARLKPLVASLTASREQLKHLSEHDVLTTLPNRVIFDAALTSSLAASDQSKNGVAVMYLDIDHFKKINDTFGHQVGDEVLCWFAIQVSDVLPKTGIIARLGGDEFAILLTDVGSKENVAKTATNIMKALSSNRAPVPTTEPTTITTSIGIVMYHGTGMDNTELLAKADEALYESKHKGRNTFTIH